MKTKIIIFIFFALLLSETLFIRPTSADHFGDPWNVSAVTAVPQFFETEDVRSFTVYTSHGWGVRPKLILSSRSWPIPSGWFVHDFSYKNARLFVPVTAPLWSPFDTIWLRAEDNVSSGYVQASLYRQPIGAGMTELLGSVQTNNVTTPSDGYQFINAPLNQRITLEPGYTYYIELLLVPGDALRQVGSLFNITVYDVGLNAPPLRERCFDGIDNDHDGRIDCNDPDCLQAYPTDCV